jgi:hypothetical protein
MYHEFLMPYVKLTSIVNKHLEYNSILYYTGVPELARQPLTANCNI